MNDEGKTALQGATLEDVLYLFALIGMAAVAAAVWFTLRPQRTVSKQPRVLPPDDDPEFLRRLSERRIERHDDDLPGGS
jgi:hypothetical protein